MIIVPLDISPLYGPTYHSKNVLELSDLTFDAANIIASIYFSFLSTELSPRLPAKSATFGKGFNSDAFL